jgi:hypothetical protein
MLARRATIELALSAINFHCRIFSPFYRLATQYLEESRPRHSTDT